ncbi:MAG: hypothetical protein VX340_04385, partial [Pseudomonadota bacterium]|nr:hypothetical protein [Pseudomonadota bacterium]
MEPRAVTDKFSTSRDASYVKSRQALFSKREGQTMPDDTKPKITPEEAAKTHNEPIIRRPDDM